MGYPPHIHERPALCIVTVPPWTLKQFILKTSSHLNTDLNSYSKIPAADIIKKNSNVFERFIINY
ncbi:MAG TPA: hypothetical protein DCY06_08190 [Bacteroidetes bacterium]|nr:hypothetical protein [Bacteroidota bacterium]